MPYRHQRTKKRIPKDKDRRRKLTDAQKIEIKKNKDGLSQRALARKYNVSRGTIKFIQDPEALAQNLQRREERGGWRQYYDIEDRARYMRNHRRYKKLLDDQGLLLPSKPTKTKKSGRSRKPSKPKR